MITTDDFIEDAGVVCCDHSPSFGGYDRYEHIGGPWWRWSYAGMLGTGRVRS